MTDIHLVGSMPFETGEELFAFVGQRLKPWVTRVPDETGDRAAWITTQIPFFAANPAYELVPPAPDAIVPMPSARIRDDAADVTFGSFDYGRAAIASHALFVAARERGAVRADARLLVCMPAPINPIGIFVHPDSRRASVAPYEAQLEASVREMLDALPHEDLAIQWDLVGELGPYGTTDLGGTFETGDVEAELARLSSWIPPDVQLGFHLCFGDTNRDNIRPGLPSPFQLDGARPDDASPLAGISAAIATHVGRRVDFVHTAIPIGWASGADFAPLGQVARNLPDTELFLGVVHPQDGAGAARTRIAHARACVERPFGIATECGMGRYGTQEKFLAAIDALTELAAASAPPTDPRGE